MPIAKGKTNASRVHAGDRILVRVTPEGFVWIAGTKTGDGVTVARVTGKDAGAPGRARMTYTIRTTAGDLRNLAPIQTMWLAPEDPAGVKRAHVEALAEYGQRQAAVMTDLEARAGEDLVAIHRAAQAVGDDVTMLRVEAIMDRRQVVTAEVELEDPAQYVVSPVRTRADEPRGRFTLEDSLAAVGMTPEVTKEETLAAIGGCWAGGALTGKALKAWADGDYVLAMALVTDQKALQARGGPDALHPEHQTRVTQAETLGDVAQDILDHAEWAEVEERQARVAKADQEAEAAALDLAEPTPDPEMVAAGQRYLLEEAAAGKSRDLQLAAYSQGLPTVELAFMDLGVASGGVEVLVAPMGTPAPGPEDLADLAHTLAEELVEHLDPEEVRAPLDPALKCQPRDVVTIHRGTRLYLVERVEKDHARNNLTGELADHTMALVSPVDPDDLRDPQWVHVDLLHVRRPVARIWTEEITGRVRQTLEVLKVEGVGFYPAAEGDLVAVRTILADSRRLPVATLVAPPPSLAAPVATLRVGESVVVDGRCYAVELADGLEERAGLVPAPHRDRLHQV